MMQRRAHSDRRTAESTTATREAPTSEARRHRRDEEVTKILDEIDGVLEENAEEFVANYVQRGGE